MTTNRDVAALMAQACRELRDKGPRNPDRGICGNLPNPKILGAHSVTDPGTLDVIHASRGWMRHSGWPVYPVPCPRGGSPSDAYHDARTRGTVWTGEYGQLRYSLLDHLIAFYEREAAGGEKQPTFDWRNL